MQGAQKAGLRGVYLNTLSDTVLKRNAADDRFSTAFNKSGCSKTFRCKARKAGLRGVYLNTLSDTVLKRNAADDRFSTA